MKFFESCLNFLSTIVEFAKGKVFVISTSGRLDPNEDTECFYWYIGLCLCLSFDIYSIEVLSELVVGDLRDLSDISFFSEMQLVERIIFINELWSTN